MCAWEVRSLQNACAFPAGISAPIRSLFLLSCPTLPGLSHTPAADGFPELRSLLAIGGVDMKQQADVIRNTGIHMVVATPGRLKDMLT